MSFLFWLLFFSISFLSVFASILLKNGQTIQTILFPILTFAVYFVFQSERKKKNFILFKKNKIKKILFLVVGSTLIWLLNAAFVFDISAIFEGKNDFVFLIPSKDSFFYGRLSEKLLTSSYETVFAFHEDLPSVLGTTPYHYFEFWLTAFFCKIFSISGFVAYSLFTIPLLQICVWVGFLAAFEQKKNEKINLKFFFFSFGLLFLSGVYFPFYQIIKGFQSTYWLTNTMFTGLSEHYFFWIAVFLSFQNQNYRACIWFVFIIPIISPTLWAACWGGLFFVGIFLLYQNNRQKSYNLKLEIIAFFLIPLSYFLFYYLTQSSQSVANSEVSILALSKKGISLITIFREIIIYLFGFFVIYIPFLILFCYEFYLESKKIVAKITLSLFAFPQTTYLFFFMGGILGGIFFYFLFPFHQERFQFLRNFILPFIQISLIYFLINNQNYLKFKVKIVFAFLLLYGFAFTLHWFWKEVKPNQVYSQKYLNSIEKELIKKQELKRGAIFHSSNYYDSKIVFNRNENFEIEGRYLAFKKDLEQFYNLDMVCINYQNNSSFSETDFFAVWLKNKIDDKITAQNIVCNDSLKWIFIEEQQLDFVIIGQNVFVPNSIKTKIKFEIKDSLSKEVFLKLR